MASCHFEHLYGFQGNQLAAVTLVSPSLTFIVEIKVFLRFNTAKCSSKVLRRLKMLDLLMNLHKEESGQDLIEYALIGLIVALGAIAGMGTLAASINAEYSKIASDLS